MDIKIDINEQDVKDFILQNDLILPKNQTELQAYYNQIMLLVEISLLKNELTKNKPDKKQIYLEYNSQLASQGVQNYIADLDFEKPKFQIKHDPLDLGEITSTESADKISLFSPVLAGLSQKKKKTKEVSTQTIRYLSRVNSEPSNKGVVIKDLFIKSDLNKMAYKQLEDLKEYTSEVRSRSSSLTIKEDILVQAETPTRNKEEEVEQYYYSQLKLLGIELKNKTKKQVIDELIYVCQEYKRQLMLNETVIIKNLNKVEPLGMLWSFQSKYKKDFWRTLHDVFTCFNDLVKEACGVKLIKLTTNFINHISE